MHTLKAYMCLSFVLLFFTCLYADFYKKDVQEVPEIWKKVMQKKARLFLHPGGELPGYFDRRMNWYTTNSLLSKSEIKAKKAFIVFRTTGPKVSFIDLKHVQHIFRKNKKWDTYDLSKMLKLSGGEIKFNRKYQPILYIGPKKIRYSLPHWQVSKLNLILKNLLNDSAFTKNNRKFAQYIRKAAAEQFSYQNPIMDEEKFFFVLRSINQAYRVFNRKKITTEFTEEVSQQQIDINCAYSFSLIPFKKGDLDKHANYILEKGVKKGFSKVALFLPIYYSGASTRKSKVQRSRRKIIYGNHYFYEDNFAIDEHELERCLQKIWSSGLSLSFVPHLESIITLNRVWESNWRIHSEIPLDKHYFMRAYGTLFKSIEKNQHRIKSHQKIRITVASEVDPAFITETTSSYNTIKKLREKISNLNLKNQIKIVWNPNGDFLHGWHKKQNKPDHKLLLKIFQNIDSIAPSMYEQHKHIINGSYVESRRIFVKALESKLRKMFIGRNIQRLILRIRKIVNDDFSLGEFGLRDKKSKGNYSNFHREFRKHNKNGNIILWSSGRWDHANITNSTSGKYEAEIKNVLQNAQKIK
ncbi:hypothetical protein [Candidatus Uabimicrobium sp. HlEnr_7]|uniref:hypothetical protein n=1 Tax=Candidatus Uabimicrobium helgolandensis TaxID=3095367 RepID=UPI003555BF0B